MTPQLYTQLLKVRSFFGKHHPVIFITILGLSLGVAVFSLEQVLITATDTSGDAITSNIGDFDQKTIDKIKKLHISTDTGDQLTFPSPRSNPFAE